MGGAPAERDCLSISADGYEELRAAIVSGDRLPGECLLEENLSAHRDVEPSGAVAVRAVQE